MNKVAIPHSGQYNFDITLYHYVFFQSLPKKEQIMGFCCKKGDGLRAKWGAVVETVNWSEVWFSGELCYIVLCDTFGQFQYYILMLPNNSNMLACHCGNKLL